MKLNVLLLLLICSIHSYGQSIELIVSHYNESGAIKLIFCESKDEAISLAETDINNGAPFLLLQSGISPVVYVTDSKFEKEYKVLYNDSGCTGPKEEFAAAYNRRIFSYLTENYGKKWKRKVRKDVVGFRKWRSI